MNPNGYDPAKRNVNIGPAEGRRFKKLGDLGEELAAEILKENGFKSIMNLNEKEMNFRFADFYAEKDGKKYLISVKTRNKYENNGKLNSRYKLGRNLLTKIEKALSIPEFSECEPAWLVIPMEEKTCDAYFGLISELEGGNGIVMSAKACNTYTCLAKNRLHGFDTIEFKNVYSRDN